MPVHVNSRLRRAAFPSLTSWNLRLATQPHFSPTATNACRIAVVHNISDSQPTQSPSFGQETLTQWRLRHLGLLLQTRRRRPRYLPLPPSRVLAIHNEQQPPIHPQHKLKLTSSSSRPRRPHRPPQCLGHPQQLPLRPSPHHQPPLRSSTTIYWIPMETSSSL